MMISIITVAFNDAKNLDKTIKSVASQTCSNIEYIIIDGDSDDESMDLIKNNKEIITYWCSEPDQGIYDAMNKGLSISTGEYILFLNAGDTFPDTNTLQEVEKYIEENDFPDFLYGDAFETDLESNLFLRPARKSSHKRIGMFTHHQSMYYKRAVIEKFNMQYDTSFKIAADYKFTCEFLEHSVSELYISKPLSVFLQGGLSQLQWAKSMKEQISVKRGILKMPFLRVYLIYFAQVGWHLLKAKTPWLYRMIRFKK